MKSLILAGGLGTRISEETSDKPKPMVLIGDRPILWHIFQIYKSHNFTEFIIATGYKTEIIEKYCEELQQNTTNRDETYRALNTGLQTSTGGRIRKGLLYIDDENIFATYGDGVADVDLKALLKFHLRHKKLATVTAVRPQPRFGRLEIENDSVVHFGEKVLAREGWINGGFFVLNRKVLEYITSDDEPFEFSPLERLAADGQLAAFKHEGFWQPMDTLREKNDLESLYRSGKAPWL